MAPMLRLSGRAGTLFALRSTEDERVTKPLIDRQAKTHVHAQAALAVRRGETKRRFLVSVVWADGRTFTRLVRAASRATAWRYAWGRAEDPFESGGLNIASVRVIPAAWRVVRPTSCSDPWPSRATRAWTA